MSTLPITGYERNIQEAKSLGTGYSLQLCFTAGSPPTAGQLTVAKVLVQTYNFRLEGDRALYTYVEVPAFGLAYLSKGPEAGQAATLEVKRLLEKELGEELPSHWHRVTEGKTDFAMYVLWEDEGGKPIGLFRDK